MKPWERTEPTVAQKVGYRTIVTKTFVLPNGATQNFQTVNPEQSEAACVIALTPEYKVIVARQFRPGPQLVMDELPGGGVDAGEDKEAAMHRELLEETGYQAKTMQFLGTAHYDAYYNTARHCFLATGCTPAPAGASPGEHEFITLRLVTIDELITIAKQGRLSDPAAVLMAYDALQTMRRNA